MEKSGKDLTKEAPRSPFNKLNGFSIIERMIDKGRAKLFGNVGEYHFDCPLDNMLFSFKGLEGKNVEAYIAEGHTDQEIADWVKANGLPKTDEEISAWSHSADHTDYHNNPDAGKAAWFDGECVRLGLDPEKTTLFDYLVADDKASFV